MTVNKVILIGNLGADPETRTAGTGTVVGNLRIATTERVKDREGNWNEQTEWHRVVCFGKTAENVAKFLSKGRQVYVEGRLRTNKWQDRDGNDRWTTEVIANQIRFLGSRDGGGGSGGYQSGGGGGYQGGGGNQPSGGGGGGGNGGGGGGGESSQGAPSNAPDDDIPF